MIEVVEAYARDPGGSQVPSRTVLLAYKIVKNEAKLQIVERQLLELIPPEIEALRNLFYKHILSSAPNKAHKKSQE